MDYSRINKSKNKNWGAACGRCGGWTSCGGMSQYAYTRMGCDCYTSKLTKIIRFFKVRAKYN